MRQHLTAAVLRMVLLGSFFPALLRAEPAQLIPSPIRNGSPNQESAHWRRPDGTHLPFASDREILNFLSTASVVSTERVGEGINKTERVLLEKEGIRMHAAFRGVKAYRYSPDPMNPSFIRRHRDHCIFEVAAYKLNRMLGLRIVPPTVEREINGKKGSLQAWVEMALMEKERRTRDIQPPDEWFWMGQMLTMHLFDNLVGNLDRHQGNLLIDPEWGIWLIDHTQAFGRYQSLHSPEKIQYCEIHVWENLKSLDRSKLNQELKGFLRGPELKALIKRRDLLVQQIEKLIRKRGSDNVLFSLAG